MFTVMVLHENLRHRAADQLDQGLTSFQVPRISNVSRTFSNYLTLIDMGSTYGPSKIAKPNYISSRLAGYWEKFSISNNRASDEPHWLR